MKFAALALLPMAFASIEDLKAKMAATSNKIKALEEQAQLNSAVAPKEATLTFTEKALRSIRGLYTVLTVDDDADDFFAVVAQTITTPDGACVFGLAGQTSECFSGPDYTYTYKNKDYEFGACATCYATNSSVGCYTCNAGYTLMTTSNASYLCSGPCVKNTDFTELEAEGVVPIASSMCYVFGGCYPITCSADGTSGSCPPSKKEDAATCFSGSDTVTLESGATKPLSEVRVGDMILSADSKGELSYSGVVALPHGANTDAATFFDVATFGGKSVKATKMHLLKTCSGVLAYAGSFKQGDCLRTVDGDEEVMSVKTVQGKGLYSVVTMNEFPVISGVVASPFALTHAVGNAYYNIHRALYKFAPALMQSSAVASANAFVGTAVMLAAGFFNSGSN